MTAPVPSRVSTNALVRVCCAAAGLVLVGVGAAGLVIPGLPATGFFVAAAWCFSRSSLRLERWLLGLPVVGALVRDYRDGLGMPRSAKVVAIAMMWTAIAASVVILRDRPIIAVVVAACGIIGTVVVRWHVPTKEHVLAARAAQP